MNNWIFFLSCIKTNVGDSESPPPPLVVANGLVHSCRPVDKNSFLPNHASNGYVRC